ncbi:MAG: MotA/TolQ/ExbB proton channel family protein [Myxococcota bacterium]
MNFDIQERLTAFAMLGATWVMWLLVLLSIIGVAIVLERTWFLWSSRDDIRRLREELLTHLRKDDLEAARRRLADSKSFEARVVHSGLEVADKGPAAAEERMASESRLARLAMERNLAFLGTVGNNAPFVGLLGTVIGIIRAFHELNESAGQVTSGLMADVGEALVATAIGLLVALPAVAFFNLFQRMIRSRLGRADALGNELLSFLKAKRGEPDEPSAEASAAAE